MAIFPDIVAVRTAKIVANKISGGNLRCTAIKLLVSMAISLSCGESINLRCDYSGSITAKTHGHGQSLLFAGRPPV